jgi:hypothetical protein
MLFGGWKQLRDSFLLLTTLGVVAVFAGSLVAAAGMAMRHPMMMMPEVIYGLYFLPTWSILIVFFGTLGDSARRLGWKVNPAGIVLAGSIIVQLGVYVTADRLNLPKSLDSAYINSMPAFRRALADPSRDFRRELLPVRLQYLILRFR